MENQNIDDLPSLDEEIDELKKINSTLLLCVNTIV